MSVVPSYRAPNPLGGPCEHCDALSKDPRECPKAMRLRIALATGELYGRMTIPEDSPHAGPCCTSDFGNEMLEHHVQHYHLIDWYWAFWAASVAVAFLLGHNL